MAGVRVTTALKIHGYQTDCICGWSSRLCEEASEASKLGRQHQLSAHPIESMEFYSHGPRRSESRPEEA